MQIQGANGYTVSLNITRNEINENSEFLLESSLAEAEQSSSPNFCGGRMIPQMS